MRVRAEKAVEGSRREYARASRVKNDAGLLSRRIDPTGATVRYNRLMVPADVRRWLEGFEAARFADQAARRAAGPMIERSIRLSLSLLQAARAAAGGQYPVDPRRSSEREAVQSLWRRLRAPYVR